MFEEKKQKEEFFEKGAFDKDRELKELMFLFIYVFFFGVFIPSFAGLFLLGFEMQEFVSAFTFYNAFLFSAIVIFAIKLVELGSKGKWADAIVHDPDQKPAIFGKFKTFKNLFRLIIASLIFFSILGLVCTLTTTDEVNTFFVPIPEYMKILPQQQIMPAGDLLLSTEPAAIAETMFFICIFSIISTIILNITKKRNRVWLISTFTAILISGTGGWILYHTLKYGGQEASLLAVLFFGFFGTLITLLSGSFIPWHIWHFTNNFFGRLAMLYANDVILIWSSVVLIFLVLITISFFLLKRKKQK